MNNLKLFKVIVSQEWIAKTEAFVWAISHIEAEFIAKKNINLDSCDAESYGLDAQAEEKSLILLKELRNTEYIYFFAPSLTGQYCDVDYETFKSYISEEDLERIRIEKIEKDNGQLSLLLKQ
jgi:hypothetical protein